MESHCLNQSRANLRRVTELAEKNLNPTTHAKEFFKQHIVEVTLVFKYYKALQTAGVRNLQHA